MLPASTYVMYLQGTFDVGNPSPWQLQKMEEAARQVNQSGFFTVILGQWHVHKDGSVWYNETPLAEVMDSLKVIAPILQDSTGMVQNVLMSFGPKGDDFDSIGTNMDAVKAAILSLQSIGIINGIDYDLETEYSQAQKETLIALTAWANGQNLVVTADPYEAMNFWTDLLQQTNGGGNTGFSWWNLQIYGGASYEEWIKGLTGHVDDPYSFLTAGYSVYQSSPTNMIDAVQGLQVRNSQGEIVNQPAGVFLWKFEYMNAYTFAEAISKVLI